MNLLERLSTFDANVTRKYKPGHQNISRDFYEKYIRSNKRYDGAVAYDFNFDRDYICFYFAEISSEEEIKQFKKDCIYTCLI